MCYAIPGKVKQILDRKVIVDYFGEERKAHNEIADLHIGDYIYAQGGFVIKKVPPSEAEEILSTWKEMFFELQQIDVRLSQVGLEKVRLDKKISRILDRATQGFPPSKDEMKYLFYCNDNSQLDIIFKTANFLRQKYHKNACCVHGILEISNYCKQECLYCGISKNNKHVKRYRMRGNEIVDAAYEAIEKYGFKALVLQSGEDTAYSIEELVEVIGEIKRRAPVLIFISFGEVGIEGLQKLYDAGARGLLLRFETSNPELYKKTHPGCNLETRLLHIRKAYEMGYLILTGGLIGLPDQTLDDVIDDIYLAKELHAEMYSFGPFIPHPDTPLGHIEPIIELDMLKILAGARLIDPENGKVLITTAFETLSPNARRKGLLSGGSSVMLNVTPISYREKYDIYPNRAYRSEVIQNQIDETIDLLRSLGRAPTDLGIK